MIVVISHIISNVWRNSYVGLRVPPHYNKGSLVAMKSWDFCISSTNFSFSFLPCGNKGWIYRGKELSHVIKHTCERKKKQVASVEP